MRAGAPIGNGAALRSASRRTAEEWVSEGWAEVARAINQRMTELGMNQRELMERSQLSKAVVGEIQNNTVQRRRSTRTLEALSVALDWHPAHLAAVLAGEIPPRQGEPAARFPEDIPGRLAAIEHQLRQIASKIGQIDSISDQLDEINVSIAAVAKNLDADRNRLSE